MVDFANIQPFNIELDYLFSFHFSMIEEKDDDEFQNFMVRRFRFRLDEESYDRLVKFLTFNDDIPIYDNPAFAFQEKMEGQYGDHGVGSSGAINEFFRFESDELETEEQQLELMEKWHTFFKQNGFDAGPVISTLFSEEDYFEHFPN